MSIEGPRFPVRFPHSAAQERTVGVGFLVAEGRILTCAHVVNLALGRDRRAQARPTERDLVYLEFPLADGTPCHARVERWVPPPVRGTRGGDIAGLIVVSGILPSGVAPARLTSGAVAGCEVRIFGYPGGVIRPDGVWALGRVSGEVGGGLLQIDADRRGTWWAQPGFSGAPVIDRATDAVVGMLKAASNDDKHRDSFAIPTALLCAAWDEVVLATSANPYKGLSAFTPDDAKLFLGRDSETRLLIDMTCRSTFVLIVGPSGVGKSSLVQAGLIPMLPADNWVPVACRPGDDPEDPFQVLAGALRRAEGAAPDVDKQRAWADEIRAHGLSKLAANLRAASGRRTLLVVDQLEELFHVEDGRVVASFLNRLLELPQTLRGEPPMVVVATLRDNFYHQLLAHPDIASQLLGRVVELSPLSASALPSVIETPAKQRGVTYERHLVDRIVADVTTSESALPLLEFALTKLWDHQRGGQIGHEAYSEIGGVVGSLGRHGEHVIQKLLDAGISELDIERTLIALISSSSREDIPAIRRTCPAGELDGIQRQVAEALTQDRLLTATQRNEQACYELAHEALIGSWKRLHRMVESDGEFLHWRTRLEEWREEDGPLPEELVAQGTHWCAQRDDVPPRLADLVRRSEEERQRQGREREEAQDAIRAMTRYINTLRLAAQAELAGRCPAGLTATLALAAESWWAAPVLEGDAMARRVLDITTLPVSRLTQDGPVRSVALSSNGTRVAIVSNDGTAQIFDAVSGAENAHLLHDGPVNAVVFSPDGTQVATASDDRTARVFDAASGVEKARILHEDWVWSVVFSPDGKRVATASIDGTVRVFDAASGVEQIRTPHEDWVWSVVFSRDGKRVTTTRDDRATRVSPVDVELLLHAIEQRIPRSLPDTEGERHDGRPIAHDDTEILRSTVSVDEELLVAVRHYAKLRGQTLGQFVEGSLRRELTTPGDTDDRPS